MNPVLLTLIGVARWIEPSLTDREAHRLVLVALAGRSDYALTSDTLQPVLDALKAATHEFVKADTS